MPKDSLSSAESSVYRKIKAAPQQRMTDDQLRDSSLGISGSDLVQAINGLSSKRLLVFKKDGDGKLMYQAVSVEEAKQTAQMTTEEGMVHSVIKDGADEGVWTKKLRAITGIQPTTLNKVLKTLESKGFIKQVKNVKTPTRKIYMLAHLKPSVAITGGPWYTDQDLDEEFIKTLLALCFDYVKRKTFPRTRPKRDIPEELFISKPVYGPSHTAKLPSPADVQDYIKQSDSITIDLSLKEVMQLMNVLAFDGKIEILRPVRKHHEEGWNSDIEENGGGMDSDEDKAERKERDKARRAASGSKASSLLPVFEEAVVKKENHSDDEDEDASSDRDTGSSDDERRPKKRSRKDKDGKSSSSKASSSRDKSKDKKAKEKKRKEKERQRAKEKKEKRRRKREKEKERERERKRKAKEKERARSRSKSRSRKGSGSDDDDDASGSDADSDELVSILDKDKKRKKSSSSSKKSSKRKASSDESSTSDSSSDSSDSDSDSSTSDSSDSSDSSSSRSSVSSNGIDSDKFKTGASGKQAHAEMTAAALDSAFYDSLGGGGGGFDIEYDIHEDEHVVYRAVRNTELRLGATEAPCGGCPQFDFCSQSGPVNPKSCEYFDGWLAQDYRA